jgi:hypothetical protein
VGDEASKYTDQDKFRCLARELQLRRRVYPRLVGSGRMNASEAQHEIALMAAIVADYHAKVQPSLCLERT